MATPASLEDTIYRHLSAFYVWLGSLRVDYGEPSDFPAGFPFVNSYPSRQNHPILRTLATRQRAFATVVDLLVSTGWITDGTAAEIREKAGDFSVLPLPIVTYEKGDPEIDPTAGGVPKRFPRSYFNQATLQWESHPWPATYWLPIRATFWCSKRYSEFFMQEWLFSQFGKLGVADREVLLPVQHVAPWGTQWQAMQLEGIADQSDLEGDPQARQIRYEVSFRLRMLHFRANVESSDPVNALDVSARVIGPDHPVDVEVTEVPADAWKAVRVSDNLYTRYYTGRDIESKWPRSGAATVQSVSVAPVGIDPETVVAGTVRSVTDRIGIANKPVYLADAPHDLAFLSVALRYLATAEVTLKLAQRPGDEVPTTWRTARDVVLPATAVWRDVQFFTAVDDPVFTFLFEGRAITSSLRFADVDIRQVFSLARLLPTSVSPGSFGMTKHSWVGLDRSTSYMVVCTTASPPGSHGVWVQDDDVAPLNTIIRSFDASAEVAFVEVVQPRSASVAISLPASLVPQTVFLQPYAGVHRTRLQ